MTERAGSPGRNRQAETGGSILRTSDPGLAAERTELAWGRSALSLFACAAAVAKGGLPNVDEASARPVVGAVLLLFGAVVWLSGLPLARRRASGAAGADGARRPAKQRELAPIAIGTAVVGFAAFVLAAIAEA